MMPMTATVLAFVGLTWVLVDLRRRGPARKLQRVILTICCILGVATFSLSPRWRTVGAGVLTGVLLVNFCRARSPHSVGVDGAEGSEVFP